MLATLLFTAYRKTLWYNFIFSCLHTGLYLTMHRELANVLARPQSLSSLKGHGGWGKSVTTGEREMSHPYSKKSKRIMLRSANQSALLGCLGKSWRKSSWSNFWAHEEQEGDEKQSMWIYQGCIMLEPVTKWLDLWMKPLDIIYPYQFGILCCRWVYKQKSQNYLDHCSGYWFIFHLAGSYSWGSSCLCPGIYTV